MAELVSRECLNCGAQFETTNPRRNLCSRKCNSHVQWQKCNERNPDYKEPSRKERHEERERKKKERLAHVKQIYSMKENLDKLIPKEPEPIPEPPKKRTPVEETLLSKPKVYRDYHGEERIAWLNWYRKQPSHLPGLS